MEEFKSDTNVKETPCLHLFHDHCLMQWVQTKVDEPDCPFCRTEIKLPKK